jgi:prepilin-type N-terminal cleavage/methylation domain-containing protein
MVKHPNRTPRHQHARELGFTLIELIVSLAILAIIAGAIAATFSVGLRVLARGGPQDRLAGAHDLATLEQVLGRDAARAACIQIQGGATVYGRASPSSGPCSSATGYGKVGGCSTAPATFCFAWPQYTSPNWSCHVAVYTTASQIIMRTEYAVPIGAGASAVSSIPETADTVTLQIGTLSTVTVSDGNYPWLRTLPVNIKATGVGKNPFSQALALHPVASDPGGSAAGVTSSGSPC